MPGERSARAGDPGRTEHSTVAVNDTPTEDTAAPAPRSPGAAVQLVRSPQQWGDEIRQSLGKTVEAVVQVGFTLKACKTAVGHGGFEEAIRHAGMDPGTARKFLSITECPAIANRAPEHDLPQSWTSLYELTKLGDDLPTAIEAGEVKPDMTRRDVIDLVQRYRGEEPKPRPDKDYSAADIAALLVELVAKNLKAASDETRDDWLAAVQIVDTVGDWADSRVPNFYFHVCVAAAMFDHITSLQVWKAFAPWLVAVAKQSLLEYDGIRAKRHSDVVLPGEDLARITLALWSSEVDDAMRVLLFKAMETHIAIALAEARALHAGASS